MEWRKWNAWACATYWPGPGVEVKLVSVMGRCQVTGSHGFTVTADALFEEITDDADVLFLPGGLPGADHLRDHEGLAAMLKATGQPGNVWQPSARLQASWEAWDF